MANILGFHKWEWWEDLIVCIYAVNRKTDPKSIRKLSKILSIKPNKIAFRLSNFTKLAMGHPADWHFSRQEKLVYNVVGLLDIILSIKVK